MAKLCASEPIRSAQPSTSTKIISLNGWLKDYAKKVGAVYLDYHGALVEGRAMKKDYTVDGLIPNAAGYARMAPLAEKAIAEALAR